MSIYKSFSSVDLIKLNEWCFGRFSKNKSCVLILHRLRAEARSCADTREHFFIKLCAYRYQQNQLRVRQNLTRLFNIIPCIDSSGRYSHLHTFFRLFCTCFRFFKVFRNLITRIVLKVIVKFYCRYLVSEGTQWSHLTDVSRVSLWQDVLINSSTYSRKSTGVWEICHTEMGFVSLIIHPLQTTNDLVRFILPVSLGWYNIDLYHSH